MKFLITLSLCLSSLLGASAFAQTLSAEQQAKLNALPPSLRAQAMAEFEKFKASQGSINVQPVKRPEVVKPKTAPSNQEIEAEFEMATDIASTAEVPVPKKTKKDLKQFGYDLFAGTPTTFAPATEIPVPADYIIGPGDQIRIQFFGKDAASYDLYVTRDGLLQIPELGPISVAGQRFTELKSEIARRVSEQMIGIKAFVSLGELRSIRVFILGDVNRPGSYTVSALSTMTNALFVSGGITPIGSLRNIQLKRAGDVISEFDLYDLLLRGDTSKDVRIQPGDVIFVPPVGSLVGISGEVKRPAIYELKGESTAMQSIDIAGGFTAKAFPSLSQIERITPDGIKEVLDLDLTTSENDSFKLANGDVLKIYSTLERAENVVTLTGMVERPGIFQWFDGMRVTDVIQNIDEVLPTADMRYVVIERQIRNSGRITVFSTNLMDAFENPNSNANSILHAKDRVLIMNDDRIKYRDELTGIISKLRNQANFDNPAEVIEISGSVRHPGNFPLEANMSISNLIRAAGDFTTDAYTLYSIVERRDPITGHISVFSTDLREALNNPQSEENHTLQSEDKVYVLNDDSESYRTTVQDIVERLRAQANSKQREAIIKISGYVRHPGEFPLESGMKVSDLIQAAGGYSQEAYTLGAELFRYIDNGKELRETVLIPIDLTGPINSSSNLHLESFDQILIKRIPEWNEQKTIEISGEVRFPGTYTIERGESLEHVVQRAGGLTDLAHPEGAVFLRESIRQAEAKQIERLSERLKEDVSAATLQEGEFANNSIETAEGLLDQLENTQATGRLVIDLPKTLNQDTDYRVTIEGGDRLLVPQKPQSVTIIGSVNYPTSHFYKAGLGRDDYINLSGGTLKRADKRQIYIVRSNGQINTDIRSRFFPRGRLEIRPGDTIVVPVDVDRMKPLRFWGEMSQIIYQIALGAAAVNSFK